MCLRLTNPPLAVGSRRCGRISLASYPAPLTFGGADVLIHLEPADRVRPGSELPTGAH